MIDEWFDMITDLSSSEDDDFENEPDHQEVWQDWNSEDLLNLWMSIVEYHEQWYLPLKRTFNQFCEFVFEDPDYEENITPPEIQAIKNHPMIRGHDGNYFFSLSYK